KARSLGLRVSCVGLTGHADPVLERLCWRFHWSGLAKLGRMIRLFKADGVDHVVMAGKVHKAEVMYHPWRAFRFLPDWRAVKAYYFRPRQDNKDDTLLLTLIDEFEKDGLTFASALDLCPELLVKPGVLTRRRPTAAEQADVEFGWQLAKKMGELDVGQSVAVKERNVLAVEAVEGTDRAILRAGELCRSRRVTLVKGRKPPDDMGLRLPTD